MAVKKDDADVTLRLISKWKGYGLAKLPWYRTLQTIRSLPVFRRP